MSRPISRERVMLATHGERLGVSIHIGDVVVTVARPAPAGVTNHDAAQTRAGALRFAARALEVAQQEIAQAQG